MRDEKAVTHRGSIRKIPGIPANMTLNSGRKNHLASYYQIGVRGLNLRAEWTCDRVRIEFIASDRRGAAPCIAVNVHGGSGHIASCRAARRPSGDVAPVSQYRIDSNISRAVRRWSCAAIVQ